MDRWAGELVLATDGHRPKDVLAGLAAAAGVPWDGPGRPVVVDAPPDPVWLALDLARQALLARADRRSLGAHHTPPDLARRLVALALDGLGPDAVVVDPACGGGAFLVAAAEALTAAGADPASVVGRQVRGVDLDPLAVAT
ncbi:MAG TPA: N-6 DNA methylase, partial [Acidimicrobiales bacterium]|nr:N-6 DNA methylase [Acidimicrobiales bacterium]